MTESSHLLETDELLDESARQGEVAVLTIKQLMWIRFKRNRLAMVSCVVLALMYIVAILAPFVAPYGVRTTHSDYSAAHPTGLQFVDLEGNFHLRPFVYGLDVGTDPYTFAKVYTTDVTQVYPISFFAKGEEYRLLGLIPSATHLFQVDEPGKVFLLGTDRQGRDLFSRIIFGAQVSLTIGLVGVFLSLVIGTLVGVTAGLYGGAFDKISQRLIEVLMSFPQIPLWIALSAALPATWSPLKVYFGITVVLSLVNWGGLSRQIRAKVLALRDQDFVVAARLINCRDRRIIVRHLFPNTLSHVLVVATTAIPGMILGETALSFLGLGIRPPMTSWGVLLSEAQETRVLLQQPWLLTPVAFVMLVAIAFNFLGDGLRDAADPFAE